MTKRGVLQPAVSVIVPCYNAAEFLAGALNSLARQTLSDFECLIIDDASVDDSASVAEGFCKRDSRFHLIQLPANKGAAEARNAGLSRARGSWIAVLDADDLFLPERLERLCSLAEQYEADMVFDDILIADFPDTRPRYRAFGLSGERPYTQEDYFRAARIFSRRLASGYIKPLLSREFLDRSGCSYDPAVRSGQDFLLYGELFALRPKCYATSYAGYLYRRREGSLSKSGVHLNCHAELTDRLLASHKGSLSIASRKALLQRKSDFQRLGRALPVMADMQSGRWVRVLARLAMDPETAFTCLRLLARRALRALPQMHWSRRGVEIA